MFRIRRIYDTVLPVNQEAIKQVQHILKSQFNGLPEEKVENFPAQLQNPMKYRFRSILFVADDERGNVKGFALLQQATDLNFCYLDFISAAPAKTGRGIGHALYERVREEALLLDTIGLLFECLPDDPALCRDKTILQQNIARLRFYERYGARPIANTKYETPVTPGDDNPPYLVFDNLGRNIQIRSHKMRAIVRAILERKYGDVCPHSYVRMVVDSIYDDPIRLRPPKYVKSDDPVVVNHLSAADEEIVLVINDKHDIHHVRERGYVESPIRIKSILKDILPTGLFRQTEPRHYPEIHIRAVHENGFVNYLQRVCENVPADKSVYPYVFPIRNGARPPKDLPIRAGYYCIDTFTPLNQNAWLAAKRAVDCTLTAADSLLKGYRIAYALVRPPGHHAERRAFGGFCYFNSAAVAAHYLTSFGKVSILDVDYHHGNGQQDIFYKRADVQTVSIHGHPSFAYPYFSGFADEQGEGDGKGFCVNFPLPEHTDNIAYHETLKKALKRVASFAPQFLIVCLGFDTAKGDPTGTWNLTSKEFEVNGTLIGHLGIPVLVVQEGGYKARSLGVNARSFFTGLHKAFQAQRYTSKVKRER
ncbi:histone deacetylase family protein [candidate division KSB1 bacterium]|nr:histone deacetylase family protein [candidate division KSB1 bacterium]